MSLINQMLRDLEERQRREQTPLAQVRVVARVPHRGRYLLSIGLGLLLLIAGLAGYSLWQPKSPPAVRRAAVPPQPVAVAAGAPLHRSLRDSTASALPGAAVTSLPKAHALPLPAPPVALASAHPAGSPSPTRLLDARLRQYGTRQGLRFDFNHPVHWKLREFPASHRISLSISHVDSLSAVFRALPLPPAVTHIKYALTPEHRLLLVFSVQPGTRAYLGPVNSNKQLEIVFASAAAPPTPAPAANSRVTKSRARIAPAVRSIHAYNRGIRALRQGRIQAAEEFFRSALNSNPYNGAAREALAELYARTGLEPEAETLLGAGLALHGENQSAFAKLYASLLARQGAASQAIRMLRAHEPRMQTDPEYYALLAGLLQHSGDYPAAADLYRRLVALDPAQGVWWAGLGISLEQIGKPDAALHAYLRARAAGGLSDAVAQYVQNRIHALKH
ncbi:MAG: tetratricopeptide repeat protein [Gammaproteobacteria bacterium]